MATELGRLQRRNVEVFDSDGFWQYGTLQWDEFYRYMTAFVLTKTDWTIFQYGTTRGAPCQPSIEIVPPGHYTLLSSAGEPIPVFLLSALPRPRNLTLSNTPARVSQSSTPLKFVGSSDSCPYRGLNTVLAGEQETESVLLQAWRCKRTVVSRLPIYFPEHMTLAEWIRKGYPSKITDTADEADMGGPTKIDSVQNLITLRTDLRNAWDNYEFGVDPTNNYRITAFTNGNADINGLHLHLDHIQDPTLRPLDDLFTDHFMQGLFKHMKGAGEVGWTYEDYDDAFGDGSLNLSNAKIWDTEEGKWHLELTLADRLFEHQVL